VQELIIGKPAMAIGLGIDPLDRQKFVYLSVKRDGGDDLRPNSLAIKFASREDIITLRLALTELLAIWEKTPEELESETIKPAVRSDDALVKINQLQDDALRTELAKVGVQLGD